MKTYNHILQGHEATIQNAIDHANGIDWTEIEQSETQADLDYKETANGIDIYYCPGTASYHFADTEEEVERIHEEKYQVIIAPAEEDEGKADEMSWDELKAATESEHNNIELYEFDTQAEARAFITGYQRAIGWNGDGWWDSNKPIEDIPNIIE